MRPNRSHLLRHHAAQLPIRVALLDVLPFVVAPLARAEADQDLHAPILEVRLQRDDCHTLLLRCAGQLADLPLVREQCARLRRTMLAGRARRCVLVDPHAVQFQRQRHLRGADIPLSERHPSGADGLHLRAVQNDPALERVGDRVVVPGLAIVDLGLGALGLLACHEPRV